jgi:hypothetical protein
MRWFSFDENTRNNQAENQNIPYNFVELFCQYLDIVNPYIHQLRHTNQTVDEGTFVLELQKRPVGGEIAAIIYTNNLQQIHPWNVVIWQNSSSSACKVSILSSEYEVLQYPILFPKGTPGWSLSSLMMQIWWYPTRILQEPWFHLFGRLFNEYIVDMYSRVEDEQLNYIRLGRKYPQPQIHE